LASTTPTSPSVSAIDAAQAALEHARASLFPIRLKTWIVLGLLAFLDQCGRSFHNGGPAFTDRDHGSWPGPHGGPSDLPGAVEAAVAWLAAHAVLVVAGVLAGLLVIGLLVALVLWVNARGTFLYLDAVARGGAIDLGRSWTAHGRAADSYFGWRLVLGLLALGVIVLAGGTVAAILVAFARGRFDSTGGPVLMLALVPVFLVLLFTLPLLVLAGMALRDFVAPLQITTGLPAGAAARVLESLVVANPGAFLVYLVLKLLAVVVTGVIVFVGGCLTCCVGFLPVIAQTVFQPLFFFERSFSVFLLKQMGHDVRARLAG
jgi:hypothetical protein